LAEASDYRLTPGPILFGCFVLPLALCGTGCQETINHVGDVGSDSAFSYLSRPTFANLLLGATRLLRFDEDRATIMRRNWLQRLAFTKPL
jgi:hypothetical protein